MATKQIFVAPNKCALKKSLQFLILLDTVSHSVDFIINGALVLP